MPRPTIIRLREDPAAASGQVRVIDAPFKVVGRRSVFGGVARFALALVIAALIGALAPPLWIALHMLADFFAS
jgi:hypothetical protein